MKKTKKVEVSVEIEGIYCGRYCNFFFNEDKCRLFPLKTGFPRRVYYKRCKQCIKEFGK